MSHVAVTTLSRVGLGAMGVVLAAWVARYGWSLSLKSGAERRSERRAIGSTAPTAWLASFLPSWGIRVVYFLFTVLILLLTAFGVTASH